MLADQQGLNNNYKRKVFIGRHNFKVDGWGEDAMSEHVHELEEEMHYSQHK
jgi:hypothetical protein